MSGERPDADQVVAAARCLTRAMLVTAEVRLRHHLPNSWHAVAILLHVEPGRAWTPQSLESIGAKLDYALKGLRRAGMIEAAAASHDRRRLPLQLTERGAAVATELRRALGGVG